MQKDKLTSAKAMATSRKRITIMCRPAFIVCTSFGKTGQRGTKLLFFFFEAFDEVNKSSSKEVGP